MRRHRIDAIKFIARATTPAAEQLSNRLYFPLSTHWKAEFSAGGGDGEGATGVTIGEGARMLSPRSSSMELFSFFLGGIIYEHNHKL